MPPDVHRLVLPDAALPVVPHLHRFVVADRMRVVVLDGKRMIGLRFRVEIPLRVHPQLFRAFLVLEAKRVRMLGRPARRRPRQQPALRRTPRQPPRRHPLAVINPPRHDRLIRIAVQKIDHDLVAHTRNLHASESTAGPRARHPHPARRILVALPIPVPAKLQLHAPVLIGPDFLTGRPDNGRRLRPVGPRSRRLTRRPIRQTRRPHEHHRLMHHSLRALIARIRVLLKTVLAPHDQVLAVPVGARAMREREQIPRRGAAHIRIGARAFVLGLLFFEPHAAVVRAGRIVAIAARPFERREAVVIVAARIDLLRRQIGAWFRVVVVGGLMLADAHLPRGQPAVDMFHVGDHGAVARDVRNRFVAGQRRMRRHRVAQHQRMRVLGMPEPVVDALEFHQPRHERGIGPVVLHAILARHIRFGEVVLDRKAVRRQHVLHDLGHGLVLEYPAIGATRREPQPWPHEQLVAVVPLGTPAGKRCARNDAVQVARRPALLFDPDGDGLAEQVL
ncbi:Uncharacterised protein [Burkholderia pseudomallei]|nr:Uncharacterised protein [Burkholderia pseudomallei]CAK0578577.1 Uncharacterised protein [Burkholderia pseudomallei]